MQTSESAAAGGALVDLFDHDALSFLAASLDASSPSSPHTSLSGSSSSNSDDNANHSKQFTPNAAGEVTEMRNNTTQPLMVLSLDSTDGLLSQEYQQSPMAGDPTVMVAELPPYLDAFIHEFNLEFELARDAIGRDNEEDEAPDTIDGPTSIVAVAGGGDVSAPLGQSSEILRNTAQGQSGVNSDRESLVPLQASGPTKANDRADVDLEDDEWTIVKKKSIGRHSRRREELIYLRGKVQELEAKMDTLKRKQQSASNPESESPHASNLISLTATIVSGKQSDSMWEKWATRQLRERQRVELVNKKLRSALETQLQIAKSLERILKKRSTFEALLETCGSSKRVKRTPGALEADKAASVFDELLGDMDRLYADADKMLEVAGLQSEASSFCKIIVKSDPVSGLAMEIIENKLLPAEPSVAYNTMWRFVAEKGVNNSDYFEVETNTTHDVSKCTFGATFTRGCDTASFRGTQMSKKYLEENRMVIVSKSIMSSVEEPASPAHGLVCEESAWTVLSLLQNPKLPSESITLCQMYSILVPKCWGPNLKAGILTEFVTTSWEKANAARDQLVENMLLEEMSKLRI